MQCRLEVAAELQQRWRRTNSVFGVCCSFSVDSSVFLSVCRMSRLEICFFIITVILFANNTSVSTSTSIQFRRAGRQGQTRTLTAAPKRLITHYVLHFHVGVVFRCHGLHFQSTHTTEVSSANHTWNWVIGSPGQWVIWIIFHVRVTGSPGHYFDPMWDPSFYRFSKKCPKCKTYFWNAEMTKVIVSCLLYWNHWMSVHEMNFYFYLWLLKIIWPENTASHISRHLEFIIEQGHRVIWVSGSLDTRVIGSLGHKMWPSSVSGSNILRRTCSLLGVCGVSNQSRHCFSHICHYLTLTI